MIVGRYFYNASSSACQEFLFGGCNGNENKFDDEESCNEVCRDTKNVEPGTLNLPKDISSSLPLSTNV